MKAIVKLKAGPGLEMRDVPAPEPRPSEVLIKVLRSAICGTDLHISRWDAWSEAHVKPPVTIGHEFSGRVEAWGHSVTGFEKGEIVSGEGHIVCGACRNCRAGRRHLCHDTVGVGINRDGAFAEYISLPVSNVWFAGDTVPLDVLACFDPLGNATHTALSFDVVGEDILITGAGPIGIMAAAIARHNGARYVVITDVSEHRLDLARKMGVDLAVNVRGSSIEDAQRQLGMREGFDVGFEMSGNPSALRDMLSNLRHGAKVALLGILPPDTAIDWDKVIFGSLEIKGIYGREMFETWYKMTSMLQSGLDIKSVLTHRFPAERYEEAFDVVASGHCGKVILEWE
jgi:threonine 3-dehydrogenase